MIHWMKMLSYVKTSLVNTTASATQNRLFCQKNPFDLQTTNELTDSKNNLKYLETFLRHKTKLLPNIKIDSNQLMQWL